MYNTYYQLEENPFNITADPSFFFPSKNHAEAFSHLIYGVNERKGIMVVTGEIGTGKTTLCRAILNHMDEHTKTAFILNPNFSDIQLLRIILKDFGIEGNFKNKNDCVDELNKFLIIENGKGNNVVILIDEAQNLGAKQLEQVRLLSNLETEKSKLLQIILTGQPELDDVLKQDELRQLRQRVAVKYTLHPLNSFEIENYVNHRIKIANHHKRNKQLPQFTRSAIDALFHYSKGTPRMLNILCDRALLAGFIGETNKITDEIISQCAMEIL